MYGTPSTFGWQLGKEILVIFVLDAYVEKETQVRLQKIGHVYSSNHILPEPSDKT